MRHISEMIANFLIFLTVLFEFDITAFVGVFATLHSKAFSYNITDASALLMAKASPILRQTSLANLRPKATKLAKKERRTKSSLYNFRLVQSVIDYSVSSHSRLSTFVDNMAHLCQQPWMRLRHFVVTLLAAKNNKSAIPSLSVCV
ncbi:MAG: hypothetical protein ACI4BG_08445 [Prevotella sp.]